ncbi:MAG: DUF5654 family protein [Patescibacteria group bacterium]
MPDSLEKIKSNGQNLKKEVATRISGYITAAFGLVAGLAWNDAILSLIDLWFPLDRNQILAKFIYALALTVVLVLVSIYLVKFFDKKDKN